MLASTALLWPGETIPILILARVLQGISGAVVWTIGLALIMDTVGSDKLGVTLGSIFSIISVSDLVAPVLGGVVYKKAGSGVVFGMGFGLLAIDFAMRLVLIEKKTAAKYGLKDTDGDEESVAAPFQAERRFAVMCGHCCSLRERIEDRGVMNSTPLLDLR